jgi:uncharacterized integral membrane protein
VTNPPGDYSTARGGYHPPPNQPPPGSQPPGPPPQGPPNPGNYPAPDQPGGYRQPESDQPGGYQQGAGEMPPSGSDAQAADAPTETQQTPRPAGFDDRGKVRRGTISALWVGLVAVAVVLILLIIFIAQNLDRVTIHFLGFSGSLPVGLVALISAVIGVLIAAIPGTVRILQLRKALKANTPKEQRLH